jgi:hypothetical protein
VPLYTYRFKNKYLPLNVLAFRSDPSYRSFILITISADTVPFFFAIQITHAITHGTNKPEKLKVQVYEKFGKQTKVF